MNNKIKDFILQFKLFFSFVDDLGLHFNSFILPAFYSLLSNAFEGLTLLLLIPVTQGVFQGNFVSFENTLRRVAPFISWDSFFKGNPRPLLLLLSLVALSVLFKNIFSYFSMTATAFNVRKFSNVLRKKIYQRYLSFGKTFFDNKNPGYLQQILIGYTSQIANELMSFTDMLGTVFSVITYLSIMFFISAKLTMWSLLAFPILHFSLQSFIKRIRHSSEEYAKYYTELGKKISNALQCVPLIKVYSSEEREREWFNYSSDRVQLYEYAIDTKRSLIFPLQETIMMFSLILVLALFSLFINPQNTLKATGLIVFFVILRKSMFSFGVLNRFFASMASISGPITQIKAVLDDQNKYFIKNGQGLFAGSQRNIIFENVSFQFPSTGDKNYVLENVNLTIGKGEMLAIVGASGSGKSTLISLLLRLYDTTSGRILFDDTDIRDYTLESLHEHMTLVSQETYLFNAPLRVNLAYGLKIEPSADELWQALRQARMADFISSLPLGLETEVGDRGINLSGGERQRLAFARAVLRRSEILILDEPATALDSTTESLIQNSLQELVAGKTSIVIAHRFSTIRHASQIIVLEQGRIVEQGNVDQLRQQKGKFYEYWEKQRFF